MTFIVTNKTILMKSRFYRELKNLLNPSLNSTRNVLSCYWLLSYLQNVNPNGAGYTMWLFTVILGDLEGAGTINPPSLKLPPEAPHY